jgi:DNA-binding CsgD family transcriptional regulator
VNLADLIERKDFERHRLYRQYGRKHRVNAAIGVVTIDPISQFLDSTTLWRFDQRWPFGESDRLNLERVFPHLLQANRICRILSVSRQDGSAAVRHPSQPWAIVGRHDLCLLEVNAAFVDLLRLQWPEWLGATLPIEVTKPLRQSSRFDGSRIAIEAKGAGDFRLLTARTVAGVDSLGRRERDVIELFASGKPYKAIAEQFAVSPTTVRNQLAAAYRKLGVHNKAELVNLLRDTAAR